MKLLTAIAAGAMTIGTSAASAPPRPIMQHYESPSAGGTPLPFSDAVRVGNILYLSGQIGDEPDGKLAAGFAAQAKQAMDNIGRVLRRAGLDYADVFHCTAFLGDIRNWPAFNKVYTPYFPAGKLPARSAFAANGLAHGALLEVECQAYAGER